MAEPSFWAGRRVFLTGHTGFKGAWLALWLSRLGAEVHGFSLAPEPGPNLFSRLQPLSNLVSTIGDIRDPTALRAAIAEARPSVVLHLAAQALVRRSYRDPVGTLQTKVDGTIGVLEALRAQDNVMAGLAAVLVVTTDKVYRNAEDGRPFREDDPLGGRDPYSATKAAAEILTASWARSFFDPAGVPVATARAGNVVGGGDWSEDRLVPDLWRSVQAGEPAVRRNPDATRPWQHVLEPLSGYLAYAEALAGAASADLPRALNFGPAVDDILNVGQAAHLVLDGLGSDKGWTLAEGAQPHEARLLSLDPGLATRTLGWRSKLTARDSLAWSAEWYRAVDTGADPRALTAAQIDRYEALP